MCLNAVTRRLKPMKLMTFYKLMRKTPEGGFISLFRFCGHHSPQEVGGVFRRSSGGLKRLGYGGNVYRQGFHGYVHKADAVAFKDKRNHVSIVECQGHVHTIGRQSHCNVIVARDMRIVKQIAGCRLRYKAWR